MTCVAAVVLAAGAATRFGSPKQELLLPRVLAAVTDARVDDVVVVEGAHRLCSSLLQAPVRRVRCPRWERGPGASLRCGLETLGDEIDAAVVVLADGPLLAPAAVERVVASWHSGGDDLVAASYGGERSHPLVIGRGAWDAVPDEGLRGLTPRLVPCDDLGFPGDVDTPSDLEQLDGPA